MRNRITIQSKTNRIFPEFSIDDIVPIFEFYTRLTGEPFLYEDPREEELIDKWKTTYDLEILEEIDRRQKGFASIKNLKNRVRQYFQMRLRIKQSDGSYLRAPYCHSDGGPYTYERLKYEELHFKVGELETCLLYTSPSPRDRQKSRMPSSA